MNVLPVQRVLLRPEHECPAMPMASDDFVPASMVFVLAYPTVLDPDLLGRGLRAGVNVFPHLAGAMTGTLEPFDLHIEPADSGVAFEVVRSDDRLSMADIEAMSIDDYFARFAPTSAAKATMSGFKASTPLLEIRLTLLAEANISVLVVLASHIALDGTGLLLFLSTCTAAAIGAPPFPVAHDRSLLAPGEGEVAAPLPEGYAETDEEGSSRSGEWDIAKRCSLGIVVVSVDAVCRSLAVDSMKSARFALAAAMSQELADIAPQLSEIAFWCDPRGTHGIPRTYTGNVGCYLHLPLQAHSVRELESRLRKIATRSGFARIAKTYRTLKQAEIGGRAIVWNGLRENVLPVNLVPHAAAGLDFGVGPPTYGQMLTRNSHGLRYWVSPDGQRFMAEICLPDALPEMLIERCRQRGLVDSARLEG